MNTAKNIERWFEGIFILDRSHKRASYAKIARAVDKSSLNDRALQQEVSAKSIKLSLFDLTYNASWVDEVNNSTEKT
ncbi:hypothetical protein [Microcoleus sp. D2_18a_D3]|uniref:hypothetical protein n=1 Tax=Microcoleus sp. D2_18a_D3 TaxID=3055330 RepID=UPI002FD44469